MIQLEKIVCRTALTAGELHHIPGQLLKLHYVLLYIRLIDSQERLCLLLLGQPALSGSRSLLVIGIDTLKDIISSALLQNPADLVLLQLKCSSLKAIHILFPFQRPVCPAVL